MGGSPNCTIAAVNCESKESGSLDHNVNHNVSVGATWVDYAVGRLGKSNKSSECSIGRLFITDMMKRRFLYARKFPALPVYIDQI